MIEGEKMKSLDGNLEKKILLIDDEVEILNLLETVLKKEGFSNIYKVTRGVAGIELCKTEKPDIIVLDIMLPDIDGFEVCKRIREFSLVPIIFLSAKSDNIDKLLGLGIGGDDYVTKPFSPKEVAYRVKAQFRRNQYNSIEEKNEKGILTFADIEIDIDKGLVKKSGIEIELTAKEYKLLLYLAKNPDHILSKRKICEQVWGEDYLGYDNTIMVHIRHLREKIEDDPGNPRYIKTIKGLGYKFSIRRSSK